MCGIEQTNIKKGQIRYLDARILNKHIEKIVVHQRELALPDKVDRKKLEKTNENAGKLEITRCLENEARVQIG